MDRSDPQREMKQIELITLSETFKMLHTHCLYRITYHPRNFLEALCCLYQEIAIVQGKD